MFLAFGVAIEESIRKTKIQSKIFEKFAKKIGSESLNLEKILGLDRLENLAN